MSIFLLPITSGTCALADFLRLERLLHSLRIPTTYNIKCFNTGLRASFSQVSSLVITSNLWYNNCTGTAQVSHIQTTNHKIQATSTIYYVNKVIAISLFNKNLSKSIT